MTEWVNFFSIKQPPTKGNGLRISINKGKRAVDRHLSVLFKVTILKQVDQQEGFAKVPAENIQC